MGQEVSIPSWADQGPVQAFAQSGLNAQDDSLSEGIGQSYPVVGYRGKVWSIRYRGERKTVIRPDDGTPAAYLDVIILGQAKSKSKSYYKKYEPGQSDGERPICSSINGLVPDPDVTTKQCDNCALCPRNVWKTDPQTGRKGRECTDYKRLAVLIVPNQTTPVFGQPLLEPAFLRVPPASLNALAIMGDSMAAKGYHYSSYVTRITFDPNKPHPEMVFKPQQPLTAEEAPVILQLRADMQVDRIINGGFAEAMRTVEAAATGLPAAAPIGLLPGSVPVSGVQTTAVPSSAVPSSPAPTMIPATASPTGNGLPGSVSAPPATQGLGLSGSVVQSSPVEPQSGTGLPSQALPTESSGGAMPAQGNPVQSQPTQPQAQPAQSGIGLLNVQPQTQPVQQQSAAPVANASSGDAGAPEATDGDIDARIANLMAGRR